MKFKDLQERARVVLRDIEAVRQRNATKKANEWADGDTTEFENLVTELEALEAKMETAKKVEAMEARFSQEDDQREVNLRKGVLIDGEKQPSMAMKAFGKALREGAKALSDAEVKAIQMDNPASGGYLMAPLQFVEELLTNIKDQVFIRGLARTFTLDKAESLGVPTLDTDIDDPEWTAEIKTGSETADMAFGRRELKPNPLAKRVKISETLVRRGTMDPTAIVLDRLAYKYSIAEEKAFLSGTGANQPLGIFTASADGISTGADTACASQTVVAADDLINCKHDLKLAYWPKAAWVFSRPLLKMLRKLKDSNNNYIWATGFGPGLGLQGNANTIVELPYYVSEYAPSTFTTGKYVAVLGNFNYYWIADAMDMQVKVLNELYAETNQIGYIGRRELDGAPVLEEAFRRLKLA